MEILSKYKLEKYQYGIDVRKKNQLYGMSGKIIYNGKWLSRRNDKIIIVEMNEAIAEREALFYLEVNGHNNIIRTLGYVEDTSNLTIFIQEFAQQGDLADMLLDNQFNITQPILVEMFEQISDAMTYIASKNIVHGDLGCRNVLVFQADPFEPKNNLVKLTDFGLARWTDHPPAREDSTIVPVRYCAPEILRRNQHASYSEKSDVYSMGVLIWEALSNSEIPYSSDAKDEDVKQKKLNNEQLPRPPVWDRQLRNLMKECWHKDPQQRPTFEQVKDKLSVMDVSEVPDGRKSVSLNDSEKHYEYQLNVDVKISGSQRGTFGKNIHEAEWVSRRDRPIILIEKKEEPSEWETLFYTTFKDHKHLVHTFGFVENDRQSIMILQERAPHGNLQSLLQSDRFKPSKEVLVGIFSQIIDAMIDVIDQGLVHGDLRCENILVFEMHPSEPRKNLIKLANFGLAHRNDPSFVDDRRLGISVRHCATEILRSAGRSNYSEYSDVYSMGVLMWQAWSNAKLPYESSITNSEIRQRKMNGEKLPRPSNCDQQLWSIMEDCWLNEPQLRYEFKGMKIRLSRVNFDIIELIRCDRCNNEVLQNEMDKHQRSCKPRPPTPDPPSPEPERQQRCSYCRQKYALSIVENHEKTCSSRPVIPSPQPLPPLRQERCQYCRCEYLPVDLKNHEITCASRPIIHSPQPRRPPPSEPAQPRRPPPSEPAQPRRHLPSDAAQPRRPPPSEPAQPRRPPPSEPAQPRRHLPSDAAQPRRLPAGSSQPGAPPPPGFSQPPISSLIRCNYCGQQFPHNAIAAHKVNCAPKPRSCMDRLCSLFPCCAATN